MTCLRRTLLRALAVTLFAVPPALRADDVSLETEARTRASAVEEKVIKWRRDIHEHPELGDQETRTSRLVAEHLRGLRLDVRTGVGRTGVVGVLKGGRPAAPSRCARTWMRCR